ncbi:uncharacterized protein LOC9633252 [Selaginella moellendorffii]|uniref:uncharacterized protein LOC9633252 n=1 Tax=Selaginella moellendorffii TaxID=88036 RepID=UPI000D1C672E|nr:uncharacterized protein LOC9633252 [Selaginella moellendorffii]|eukprot:XP_024530607.1 uncharacterized protein LOC9633252 [Selaginella moellendorffii]
MDVPPEEATFIAALGACTKCGCYDRGREIHARIKEYGLDSSLVLGNTLINMYGKCRALRDARAVFDRMPERSTVSWNAIIGAYAQNSQHREALELFREMITTAPGGIVPDEVTFLPVLQSCSGLQDLVEGEAIHDLAAKLGLESNVVIANAVINMYGKCGRIAKARDLFDRMKRRSIVSLNTIISAYALNGCGFQAIDLYKRMAELEQQNFQPNDITFVVLLDACGSVSSLEIGLELHREIASRGLESRINVQNALINMYGKCGSVDGAKSVFLAMASSSSSCRDVISWTAMITALAQNSREEEAVGLFREMELEGVKANEVTLAALATAFVNLGNFGDGCHIYPRVAALGMKLDVVLGTVLIGLHGICGEDVVTASKIFEQIEQSKKNHCFLAPWLLDKRGSPRLDPRRSEDPWPGGESHRCHGAGECLRPSRIDRWSTSGHGEDSLRRERPRVVERDGGGVLSKRRWRGRSGSLPPDESRGRCEGERDHVLERADRVPEPASSSIDPPHGRQRRVPGRAGRRKLANERLRAIRRGRSRERDLRCHENRERRELDRDHRELCPERPGPRIPGALPGHGAGRDPSQRGHLHEHPLRLQPRREDRRGVALLRQHPRRFRDGSERRELPVRGGSAGASREAGRGPRSGPEHAIPGGWSGVDDAAGLLQDSRSRGRGQRRRARDDGAGAGQWRLVRDALLDHPVALSILLLGFLISFNGISRVLHPHSHSRALARSDPSLGNVELQRQGGDPIQSMEVSLFPALVLDLSIHDRRRCYEAIDQPKISRASGNAPKKIPSGALNGGTREIFLFFSLMIPESVQAGSEAQLNGELAEDFTIESKVTLVTLLKDALFKLDSNDGGDAPGVESLASLLVSTDAEIVLLALEVLAAAQTKDGYSSKTMSYVREISYGWPSRDQWFCAKESARSLYFEFYQDGKLEVIQVEVEELCREDCLDLFNRLVRDFKVPGELRFSLLTRIRFAKAFSSAETRYEYLRISILALGLVPHVEKSQLSDLEAVACDGVVPESVRISALYALGAHGKEDILTTAERDAKVHEFLSGKVQHSSGFIKALLDNSSAPIDLQDEDRKRRRQLPSSVFGVLSLNEALIWLEDELKDISSSDDDSLREKQRMIRDLLSKAFEGGEGEVEQFLVKIFDNPRLLRGTSSSSKVSTDGWKIVEATMSWKLSDELHAKLAKLILDDVTAVPEAVLLKALSASFMSTLVGVGGYEFLRQLPVSVVMKLERFPPTDKCGGYAEMAKSLCEDFGSLIEGKCAEKVEVLPWIVERMLFNNDGHCNAFFFKQLFMSGALDKLLIAFEAFGSCSTPVGSSTTGMAPSLDVYFSIFCQLLDSEWADLTGEEDEKRIKQQIFYAVLRVIRLCDISQFTPRMAAAVLEQLCKKNPAEVDDLAVSKLVSMGYDKAVARAALEKKGNSIERAVEKMAEENFEDALALSFPPMLEMVDLLLKLMNCHGSEDLILTIWRNGVLHERETALVSLVCQLGSEAAAAKLLALLVTKDTAAAVVIRRRGMANQFLELLLSPKFETSVESAAVVLRLLFGGGDHGGNPFAASGMSEDQHKQAVVWFGNFICQTPPTAHGPKLLKLGETLTRNRKMALELVTNARDLAALFERLLDLSVDPDSKSCACKTVLHLLEDHQMLYHRMVRAIRARLLANAADVHDFLRDMSSWAFREPAIFLRASFDTCEVVRVGKDQHYIFLKGGQVTGNGGDESALVSTHFLDVFAQLRDPLLAGLDDVRIELLTKIYDEFPDFLLGHEAGILDRVLESESKASSVSKFLKAVWRENRDSVLQALMKAFSLELISTSKLVRLSKVLESCYEFLDALLADRIVKALAALDLDHPEAAAVVTSVFEVLANFLSSHRHRPVVSIPPYVSEAGVIAFLQAMYATAEDPVAAISTGAEETTQNMWAFLATLDPDLRLQILRTCPDLLPELTQHQQAPNVALQDQAAEHDRHHTEDEHETEEEDQNEDEDDEYANGEDGTEDGDGEDDVEEDDEMQDGLEGDQCEQEQEIFPQSWVVDNDDLETLVKFLRFAPESFDERKLVSFLKKHTNHAELARVLVRMLLRTENSRAFGSPANGLFHRNFVLGKAQYYSLLTI